MHERIKELIDWIKFKILEIELLPHIFVLYHRIHYKTPGNIYDDRPLWVVKLLGQRITDDFFEEDATQQSIDAMYRITNDACIELKRRQNCEILKAKNDISEL